MASHTIIMENDDELHRQPAVAATKTNSSSGRRKASVNYKIDEDMKLASAYVHVTIATTTTNASSCTVLFWDKVRDHFMQSGGSPSRTTISLQNRFKKVLHAEISHYIGYLQSEMHNYHHGWSKHDYATQAKAMFLSKHGKQFPHDMVYDILKRSLPIYNIDKSAIDSRVCRELFSIHRDNNNRATGAAANRPAILVGRRNLPIGGGGGEVDEYGIPLVRPVGIKKAKRLALMAKAASKEKKLTMAANNDKKRKMEECAARQQRTNEALHRLADAAEASSAIMKERLKFQWFSANPDLDASRAYFNRMMNYRPSYRP